jgi:hypothetical protein
MVLDGTENNTPDGYPWAYDVHGMMALHHKEGIAYRENAIEDVQLIRASALAETQSKKGSRCTEKPHFRCAAVAHGNATI